MVHTRRWTIALPLAATSCAGQQPGLESLQEGAEGRPHQAQACPCPWQGTGQAAQACAAGARLGRGLERLACCASGARTLQQRIRDSWGRRAGSGLDRGQVGISGTRQARQDFESEEWG